MGHVQGSHHSDPLHANHTAAGLDFTHLVIEVTGRIQQRIALFRLTGDLVITIQDINGDGTATGAHAWASMALRRWIMASTFTRAISFFSINLSRSRIQLASLLRKEAFSFSSWAQ